MDTRSYEDALTQHKSGNLPEAERMYRSILQADSNHADAWHFFGVLCYQLGRHQEASDYIHRAISLNANNNAYHSNLGLVYRALGRWEEAGASIERALQLAPDDAVAYSNLGRIRTQQGRLNEAAVCFARAEQLGIAAPKSIHVNQPPAAAVESATDPAELRRLGRQLGEIGQLEDAIRHYRRAVALDPENPTSHNCLGHALFQEGKLADAIAAFKRSLEIKPGAHETLKDLGALTLQSGDRATAEKYLREALDHNPNYVAAYLDLSQARRFEPEDPEVERMKKMADRKDLEPNDQAMLRFALGKAYEDTGHNEEAFQQYQLGNSIHRSQLNYRTSDSAVRINQLVQFFDQQRFQDIGDKFAIDSELPIFIVGMPRSGTTLVEQIVASHPSVCGAGELNRLRGMMLRLPTLAETTTPFPYCLAQLDPEVARREARDHVDALKRLAPGAERVTDKMPWNFHMVGVIAMMFPRAKVIHCMRDPMDNCVSCYCQHFARGQEFSWDLTELGQYYCEYQRLADHWRSVLPMPMFEAQYEALIDDTEQTIRKLIEFCGLPWDDRCLEFHKTDRAVKTNMAEVRRPIFRSSLGRWQKFSQHLGPLREALGLQHRESA